MSGYDACIKRKAKEGSKGTRVQGYKGTQVLQGCYLQSSISSGVRGYENMRVLEPGYEGTRI